MQIQIETHGVLAGALLEDCEVHAGVRGQLLLTLELELAALPSVDRQVGTGLDGDGLQGHDLSAEGLSRAVGEFYGEGEPVLGVPLHAVGMEWLYRDFFWFGGLLLHCI